MIRWALVRWLQSLSMCVGCFYLIEENPSGKWNVDGGGLSVELKAIVNDIFQLINLGGFLNLLLYIFLYIFCCGTLNGTDLVIPV